MKIKNRIPILLILLILISFLIWIKIYISKTHDKLHDKLTLNALQSMKSISKNIEININQKIHINTTSNLHQIFQKNKKIQKEIERNLALFISPNVQYVYLVYKDKNDQFRFLADGSATDKAHFNQKIDFETMEYLNVFKNMKDIALTHDTLKKLSITYLYPIMRQGKVEALLIFDFSSHLNADLEKILEPVTTLFILIYTLIALFISIIIVQTYYYFQARKRSYIDTLTQTYNRRYLRQYLKSIDIGKYQILMLDFDHFKEVNDYYGHEMGDTVLRESTKEIKKHLKKEDKIFRYGGEEFLLFICNTDIVEVEKIADKIRLSIQNYDFTQYDMPTRVNASIGINISPKKSRNIAEAIKVSDIMLYKAKLQGRNRIISNKDTENILIEDTYSIRDTIYEIKDALDNDRVLCHYHKIVDANGKLHKYEALVRYKNTAGELIYPNHFLSDILNTSIYIDLSKRVIDLSIEAIKKHNISISINMTVIDLVNEELVLYLIKKLDLIVNSGV